MKRMHRVCCNIEVVLLLDRRRDQLRCRLFLTVGTRLGLRQKGSFTEAVGRIQCISKRSES